MGLTAVSRGAHVRGVRPNDEGMLIMCDSELDDVTGGVAGGPSSGGGSLPVGGVRSARDEDATPLTPLEAANAWVIAQTPNDLGSDHGWAWSEDTEAFDYPGNIVYRHLCSRTGHVRHALGVIDVTSGKYHTLHSRDPLHVEASVLCPDCGDHGWIRDGKWVSA